MPSVSQTLAPWHEFYGVLGSASATMIGLLFVAASVGSGAFARNRTAGLRMFLSASLVHFGSILAACLIVIAPIDSARVLGMMVGAGGMFGLAYSCAALRGVVRDGISAKIDREDRVWYGLMPIVGYACEAVSGLALATRLDLGCEALAASMGVLLVVAVHNAWDITIWSVMRDRN